MNLELRHLRYFVAVADELHFGRAAERLHISQPPLSMQIRALEDILGTPLFHRTRRRVSLTKAGEIFVREARQILERTEGAILAAQRAARGEVGELAIGFVSSANFSVLPPLLRQFRARAPGVRLTLRESTTDVQLVDLAEGRIDVGLVLAPIDAPALAYRPIHREPLVVALPEQHRLAGQPGAVRLADLADDPFVLIPRHLAPGFYDDIVSYCRRTGFSPRVEQEAVQMQTIVSLVSSGIGVSLMPASMENLRRTGVIYKPLAESSPVSEIGLVWRRDDELATLSVLLELAPAIAEPKKRRARRRNP